ncbi:hypothetical protein J7E93_27425 [Streptomyces sp. ISL-36]|uniref:SPW repeat domain-containing protein n=1 Tax=Streptomyces sp. ISL-36 TaxID=2819182 RepID=UPI001BE5C615|nr:hypothetical protein [Streptomyces sp. ISL-36]MBT2443762.1 hypothetical protein [Streptomyces sp. ISL-36]
MTVQDHRRLVPRVADPGHVVRQGAHDQILGLLMLAAAAVLVLWPMATQDGPKDAQVNEVFVGLVVLFLAGKRIYRGSGLRSDAVIGLAGVWMIASPFVLEAQDTAVHTANRVVDIAAGSVLVVLSLLSVLLVRLDRKRRPGGHTR